MCVTKKNFNMVHTHNFRDFNPVILYRFLFEFLKYFLNFFAVINFGFIFLNFDFVILYEYEI